MNGTSEIPRLAVVAVSTFVHVSLLFAEDVLIPVMGISWERRSGRVGGWKKHALGAESKQGANLVRERVHIGRSRF